MSLIASVITPTLARPVNRSQGHMRQHQSNFYLKWFETMSNWSIDIGGIWMVSHMIYATCMLATMFISSISGTYVLVGIAGISWATTIWAPFAIISIELSADADTVHNNDPDENPEASSSNEPALQVGTVIGLHNIAIAVPQILAALLSSLVFWLLDGSGSAKQEESVGWVLRIGGISALVAAFLAMRLGHNRETRYSKLEEV
jgi:solute carrier family 45 protein 1/2/4